MWFFRAVALDLDGTCARDDRLSAGLLDAVDEARRERAVLLVTGRTAADLERVFPGLADHFDAVVTENGAVLARAPGARRSRPLHEPVGDEVARSLTGRGVATQRGEVLLALAGSAAGVAVEALAEAGLDHQVVHNRGAAMILPAGATKGSGLAVALDELGLSPHNVVAVGDAENDLSLLRAAEVGAAVADAVPSVAEHSDLVLDAPDGRGVAELLVGPLLAGREHVWPARHRVGIGTGTDGTPVTLPGSQASILVQGASGSGKSYLAGLLAERWLDAGYTVLVVDPEGDHRGLAQRADVLLVDAAAGLPAPHEVLALLRPGRTSVVLDLSALAPEARFDHLGRLPVAVAAERSRRGVPHWVVHDEAQHQVGLGRSTSLTAGMGDCLVTWRPDLLDAGTVDDADVVIELDDPGPQGPSSRVSATLRTGAERVRLVVGPRRSDHVRHQHKYAVAPLPPERRFYFRDGGPSDPGAASLEQFDEQLGHLDAGTVAFHADRGDFSRWVAGVLGDADLAHELALVERDLVARHAAAAEDTRLEIRRAVQRRYLKD